MSFVPPITVTDGSVVSQNIWNEQIRDNFGFLHSPPMIIAARVANQNVSSGTITLINFDTQVFDNVNGFTPTSANLLATHTGYYDIAFTITAIDSSFAPINNAEFTVLKNGAPLEGGVFKNPNNSYASTTSATEGLVAEISKDDIISLQVLFKVGFPTSPNVTGQLSMVYVGES